MKSYLWHSTLILEFTKKHTVSSESSAPSFKELHTFPHDQYTSGDDSQISSTLPPVWPASGSSLGFSHLYCKLIQHRKPVHLTRPPPEYRFYQWVTCNGEVHSSILKSYQCYSLALSQPPLASVPWFYLPNPSFLPQWQRSLSTHRFPPNSLSFQGCPDLHSHLISISPGSTNTWMSHFQSLEQTQVSSHWRTWIPISFHLQGPHIFNIDMAKPYRHLQPLALYSAFDSAGWSMMLPGSLGHCNAFRYCRHPIC